MFYQVRIWPPIVQDFYIIFVLQFVPDHVTEQQVTEICVTLSMFICGHVQYGIAWIVDYRHDSLYFDAMFNSNYPSFNNINNVHRQ